MDWKKPFEDAFAVNEGKEFISSYFETARFVAPDPFLEEQAHSPRQLKSCSSKGRNSSLRLPSLRRIDR